jgi:AsmA-like protein
VIRGLDGTLSSAGTYRGVLERIEVDGTAEIPDFSLDLAGQAVPLNTRFKAIVDGTNGDTILDHVDATLNKSKIVAKGSVVRTQEVKGRHIELDVRLDGARLEDLMQLAVKAARPPLTGRVDLATKMVLPAGAEDVIDRLRLDGTFQLAQAKFTNVNVQRRITTLSRRGRGEENDEGADSERVVSNLRGRFKLAEATLTFSELTFAVPGSVVQLAGYYNLHTQEMNFTGDLLTDATLADMTSGFKSLLARLAQPFFRRKGGGSKLPIRISGTREKPEFGLDLRRVLRRG